jgi:chorismate mutase
MPVRGSRGAIDVPVDESAAILQATRMLLASLLEDNPTFC